MGDGIDAAKVEAFGGRMLAIMNDAVLAIMMSIGHRTKLFDVMAGLQPSTSADIAKAAGLDERYVREWLGAMVTGKIITYDPTERVYHLPPEHAAMTTRSAGPNNFASFMQNIAIFSGVEEEVIRCFHEGGGVPYEKFPRFHHVMSELSGSIHEAALIPGILPLSGMVDRLREGADVLDVGCGMGRAVLSMARAFPASRFTGLDLSDEAIAAARAQADQARLSNATFQAADAAAPLGSAKYDLVTAFDVIHDQADPAGVLANIRASLRPGGTFLCVDVAASSELHENIDHPMGPALYGGSTLHCMTVSLARNGAGLGAMWGQQVAERMIRAAGFTEVTVKRVEGDFVNNYYVAR